MNCTLAKLAGLAVAGSLAAGAIAQTRVQILHASDLEGGVEAIGDAPNFAAVVAGLEARAAMAALPSILLSSGDNYIPGPFFSAAADPALRGVLRTALGNPTAREGDGRVDIAILNVLGIDAAAIGNHEFDNGAATFAELIGTDIRSAADVRWLGTQFPYLSANLDFAGEPALAARFTSALLPTTAFRSTLADLAAAAVAPKLAPAAIVQRGGQSFGIVGATTPLVRSISSTGGVTVRDPGAGTNDMVALASIVQPSIDALRNAGIDKIVLVSHLQQFALEQALTPLLSGVDIVIAGGSDTRLADATDRLRAGDVAQGPYPFVTQNADGEPALIVSTDGQYSYVGRLVVDFDALGVVVPASVVAAESGAFVADEQAVTELFGTLEAGFTPGSKGALVRSLTDAVSTVVTQRDGNVLGRVDVFLEGRRTPVRTEETNFGNLTAEANLAAARVLDPTVLVSHKNGGGIRNPIGSIDGLTGELGPTVANPLSGKLAGEVSQLDVENSLRFNNGLSSLTLTREQFKQVLEHAVAATGPGSTPGQFGQFAGVSFSFDVNRAPGDRVRFASLTGDGVMQPIVVRDGLVIGTEAIRLVTLDFLASGGDSYPFPAFIAADPAFANRVDLRTAGLPDGASTFAPAGSEQDAFAEFLLANFSANAFDRADTRVADDQRIQQIGTRPTLVTAGSGAVGSLLFFGVTDAEPLSLAVLQLGFRAGEQVFDLGPLGTSTLGVDAVVFVALSLTTPSGDAAGFLRVPNNVVAEQSFVAQMLTLSLAPTGLATATSDTVAFAFRP